MTAAAARGARTAAGAVWNFAYGANINPTKMKTRGMRPLRSVVCRLPNAHLTFNHAGGMGNIVPALQSPAIMPYLPPGDEVFGVAHLLLEDDWEILCAMESDYDAIELAVEALHETDDNMDYPFPGAAIGFVGKPTHKITPNLPIPGRYIRLLRHGARVWKFPEPYIKWLDELPSIDARLRGHIYRKHVDTGARIEASWKKARNTLAQRPRRRFTWHLEQQGIFNDK